MTANFLETLWTLSLIMAAGSLVVMAGLIVSRLLGSYGDRRREVVRLAIVQELYRVMDGETSPRPRLKLLMRHTRVAAQAILELSTLIRGDALKMVTDCLEETGLDRRLIRLSHSWSPPIQILAIDALGYLGRQDATRRLAQIASRSGHVETRIAAARALQTRGDTLDADAVVGALKMIGNRLPGEFEAVLDGLACTAPSALESILATPGLPVLAYAQALRSLGESGRYASLPVLIEMVASNEIAIRCAALDALGRLGHPAAEAVVAANLSARSDEVRAHAARAAGQIVLDSLCPELVTMLEDASWDVRISAARALSLMGDKGLAGLSRAASAGTATRSARTAQMLLAELGKAA